MIIWMNVCKMLNLKKEYEALAVEYEIKQAMIDARKEKKPYSKKNYQNLRVYNKVILVDLKMVTTIQVLDI